MFSERMKECRLALGYSAEQVAAFLNVSPATIYRYENGDISKLPARLLSPLASFLNTTPEHLMGWESDATISIGSDSHDDLTEEELSLVKRFRHLSPDGKRHVLDQLEFAEIKYGEKYSDLQKEAN